jgi:hypothetical protein
MGLTPTPASIINRRRDALIVEFKLNEQIVVHVESPDVLPVPLRFA